MIIIIVIMIIIIITIVIFNAYIVFFTSRYVQKRVTVTQQWTLINVSFLM